MHLMLALLIAGCLSMSAAAQSAAPLPYQDPSLPAAQRARDLVGRMTLEEKAAQSVNTAPAIPRLGVPAYDYWSEGLHGIARSGYATLFPQAIGMAATWDAPLVGQEGAVVSTEARAKYNEAVRHDIHSIYYGLTIWSPNINIFRDPRWGRGQETYGEDPFLTGTMGAQFVRGLQGDDPKFYRAIATPKHYAVHSGAESERHRFNVEPSTHDLWDTYLPAFRKTVVEGKADSIMCAYNAVDGKPACASDLLLKQVLREDWKFQGFVTSDCDAVDDFFRKGGHGYSPDAVHAAAAGVLAGTDTNCGTTYRALPAAVKQGLLTEADVDRTLTRLFEARMRLGLFDPPAAMPYAQLPFAEVHSAAHQALSLRASEEAMVLLQNDGLLPLAAGKYRKIAVIGPNAASLTALEGNYNAIPKDPQMPVDALAAALPGAQIVYAQGAPYAEGVVMPMPRTLLRPAAGSTEQGLKAEYFRGDTMTGAPVATRVDHEVNFDWAGAAPVDGLAQDAFSVRWSGVIAPPVGVSGPLDLEVQLAQCYPCQDHEQFAVTIDGVEARRYSVDAGMDRSSDTPHFAVAFPDGKPRRIEIEYGHRAPLFGGGLTLAWVPPAGVLQQEAVMAAQGADLVVAMVGLSRELEGEEMPVHIEGFSGGDRTDIKLPAAQRTMLEQVAATGKPMVLVLMNGSALAVNGAEMRANAVLEAWYPGEFGGEAIAETLLGKNNPAGRLPVTFYRSVEDLPAFTDYSMKNRTYRYYTGKPLYGFGYGLSYSKFAYGKVKLSAETVEAGQPLRAEVEVRNTGKLAGDEVAEVYLMPPAEGNGGVSPKLQLTGFQRVRLGAGESRKVQFTLTPRELSLVGADGTRSVQAGRYGLAIGGAQPGEGAGSTARFQVKGTMVLAR